jgi:diguanylate cyclase (GGDEF)-like protein
MSIFESSFGPTVPPAQDISGVVTGSIIRYIKHYGGEPALKLFLQKANVPDVAVGNLQDPTSWVSEQEAANLFKAAVEVTNDPQVGRQIGAYHLRIHEETGIGDLLASLGSPQKVLANISKVASKYTTFTEMDALEVGDAHAVIRVRARQGHGRHIQMCYFTHGLLSQSPVLFGLVPAVVTETQCQAKGSPFCLYSVAWEQRQWSQFVDEGSSLFAVAWDEEKIEETDAEIHLDPQEELQQLKEQVEALTNRLEAVYMTASDLLAVHDVNAILTRVTQRAGRSVNAPRYLLAVRTSDDEDYQIHHYGFTEPDAKELADQILESRIDETKKNILLVEVKSSRQHYGWIAAVNPENMEFFEQDKKTFTLYASYAATALDVATALDAARKSDSTARALLQFGTKLAQTKTQKEVAELLAESIVEVVGSQGAMVLLWNEESQALIEVARKVPKDIEHLLPIDKVRIDSTSAFPIERLKTTDGPIILSTSESPQISYLLSEWGLKSSVNVALRHNNQLLGMASAGFTEIDNQNIKINRYILERLSGLVNQAVIAFTNAQLLEQISHMAWHDALTGLPNRRLFEDRLTQELARSQRTNEPVTVFYVDLDKFKHVNDTYGHSAGDELIRQVAKRLTETVRVQDTVARLGGDEFAIILPGLGDQEVMERLARRILEALNKPFVIEGIELRSSGSIGIATTKDNPGLSFDELVRNADAAMYQSKSMGRNTFRNFEEIMLESEEERQKFIDEMPKALAENQFELVYQAQIDLNTVKITGVEALVRWNHPSKGTLLPESFLAAAEESGFIVNLDKWVIENACHQLSTWDKSGLPPLKMSVNLSYGDFIDGSIVQTIKSALEQNNIEPSRLEVEISESLAQKEDERVLIALERLHDLGVRVAIDDVGATRTLASSFKDYRVDALKIDNSIISQLKDNSAKALDAIASIKTVAKDLSAQLIAEGVEDLETGSVAAQYGMDLAQGFFYGPPVTAKEIEIMVRAANLKTSS